MRDLVENSIKKLKFNFPYSSDDWLENMYMENYHKHTTWSDVFQPDSATMADDFMKKVYEQKGKCMFSGEHGYQGEWLYIYGLCHNKQLNEKLGINIPLKFRYSTEVYWVKDRHEKDRTNCHMVIIAKNYQAMRKLNYIISIASDFHEEGGGYYGKPRIDLELLFTLNPEDVYITSACIAGWKYEDAKDIWLKIWKHFGDSFFLEYQCHNTPQQIKINSNISKMAKEYGIQTIVGLDTHCLDAEDSIKRDNLLIRKGIKYDDEDGWFMDYPDGKETFNRLITQGVLSQEEIILSMMNTCIFINGCEEVTINTEFKIPILDEHKTKTYQERVDVLKSVLLEAYENEDDEHKTEDRKEGLLYELDQIDGSTAVDYFITNHAIINLATSEKYGGQLTTTSRGSASSYYVSKLLGFTTMDRFESEVPMYPERFITKERVLSSHQCPDIDYNVAKQDPFDLATKELLGEHGCYPLMALGKFGELSGWKMFADVKGVDAQVANEVSKHIKEYNDTLKHVDDEEDKKKIHIEDFIPEEYWEMFEESKSYQGIIEQAKVHACGRLIFNGNPNETDVIGYGDIRYEIGLIRCHSESTGKSILVVCVEGDLLDAYGYVKNDYLIVDVVAIIHKLYASIGMKVPTVNELRKMIINDPETWRMYAIGATCCLNQCEKSSTTKRVMQYKPQNLKELSAFIAGIRPGFKSLLDGFLNRITYSNGEKAIDELLEDSFSYMLYQEAVMKIFAYLGIPIKDSYDTIKGISKKKLKGEKLKQLEDNLKTHWFDNIGNLDNFEPVYKVVKDSAKYSFNAPHALAMACDSTYEAWMKAHHTSKFYEVTLNHYMDKSDKDKVNALSKEAMNIFGYKMGTYEYGKDNSKFTVDDDDKFIYPNLASIKGIGVKVVKDLIEMSNNGYNNIIDVYNNIKGTAVNKTHIRNLIKIRYFKAWGDINFLLQIIDILETFGGRTQLSQEDLIKDGYDVEMFKTFGRATAKKIVDIDEFKMYQYLFSQLERQEDKMLDIMTHQYNVLKFVDYIDPSFNDDIVFISNIEKNQWGTPFFELYRICDGSTAIIKVNKRYLTEINPVKEHTLIKLTKPPEPTPKKRKNKETGKWEELEETELILEEYSIITLD